MLFMNEFVEREIKNMKEFISKISVGKHDVLTTFTAQHYYFTCL